MGTQKICSITKPITTTSMLPLSLLCHLCHLIVSSTTIPSYIDSSFDIYYLLTKMQQLGYTIFKNLLITSSPYKNESIQPLEKSPANKGERPLFRLNVPQVQTEVITRSFSQFWMMVCFHITPEENFGLNLMFSLFDVGT